MATSSGFHPESNAEWQQRSAVFDPPQHASLQPAGEKPSFTFVVLGTGGGPLENDCSCYLLKPADREWSQGSIVIEGGSWLGALTRIMENVGPTSAFADVDFPHYSPALRAGYLGSFAHSFLISHAHLDHILGMVLGSASLPGKRKVYGLKATLDNLMDVFNGKIWPKLASFEDDGGPAVYHFVPLEHQNDVKVDEAFTVLPFALSHGLNPSVPPAPPTPSQSLARSEMNMCKRYSLPVNGYFPNLANLSPVDRSLASSFVGEKPTFTSPFAPERAALNRQDRNNSIGGDGISPFMSSSKSPRPAARSPNRLNGRPSRRPRTAQGSEQLEDYTMESASPHSTSLLAAKPAMARRVSVDRQPPALDSTAFFITNNQTGKDVLFFGDVEPDCVSRSPRNKKVWTHAARRYCEDKLNTIFLECSFPGSHPTEFLYGHLSVNHLFDELRSLSRLVLAERKRQQRRQKMSPPVWSSNSAAGDSGAGNRYASTALPSIPASPNTANTLSDEDLRHSLQGLSIIIIHVKMALFPSYRAADSESTPASPSPTSTSPSHTAAAAGQARAPLKEGELAPPFPEPLIDPRAMSDRIYDELNEMEAECGLGVRFVIAKQGMKIEC